MSDTEDPYMPFEAPQSPSYLTAEEEASLDAFLRQGGQLLTSDWPHPSQQLLDDLEGPDADYDWERSDQINQRLKREIRTYRRRGHDLLYYLYECPKCEATIHHYSIRKEEPCPECPGPRDYMRIYAVRYTSDPNPSARFA